jgi:hypothetical protein
MNNPALDVKSVLILNASDTETGRTIIEYSASVLVVSTTPNSTVSLYYGVPNFLASSRVKLKITVNFHNL